MKITLIIVGALIGIFAGANYLKKKVEYHKTVEKMPVIGCLVYLVYGALGGVIGLAIYSLFK